MMSDEPRVRWDYDPATGIGRYVPVDHEPEVGKSHACDSEGASLSMYEGTLYYEVEQLRNALHNSLKISGVLYVYNGVADALTDLAVWLLKGWGDGR